MLQYPCAYVRGLSLTVATSIAILAAVPANAAPIFDTFGPLDDATFGGQGIPNDEVAVSDQFVFGDSQITVAMSATQRFSNPALTNDGAGTFFATPGSNFGGANESTDLGALWNWNFYLNVEGVGGATPTLADFDISIFYDFDTGLDDFPFNPGVLGEIDLTACLISSCAPGLSPATTLVEDSQNLLFPFLSLSVPGLQTPPPGAFDPNAAGEYNFAISVTRLGFPVETVAMDVVVVPEPVTGLLMVVGLVGLAAAGRRSQ